MTITVQQLADLIRGTVVGDGSLPIRYARTLHSAEEGDITFLEKDKNVPMLEQSRASAAVVTRKLSANGKTVIQVADPLMAFATIFQHLQGKAQSQPSGISPRADVHPSVQIGEEPSMASFACIGEGTVIGKRCKIHHGVVFGKNCRVGDDVSLYPNVVLYDDTVLGDRVIIHAEAIIGADGFGYRFHQGRHVKVPQLSNVIVGSDVEIGATPASTAALSSRRASATAPRSTTSCRSPTTARSANTIYSRPRSASPDPPAPEITSSWGGRSASAITSRSAMGPCSAPAPASCTTSRPANACSGIRPRYARGRQNHRLPEEAAEDAKDLRASSRNSISPPQTTSPRRATGGESRMSMPSKPIGLLAGSGRFPILFAEKARQLGRTVVCVGINGEADPELEPLVDRFYWTGIAKLGRMIRCFKREGVQQIVMAGKIHKVKMNAPFRLLRYLPDWRMIRAYFCPSRQDNKDDTLLLRASSAEFERDGMTFASALDFCPELLVKPGLLTQRDASASEEADIAFGWELAKEMGRLDVGQSVAVRERAVLAVEAIEGTDQAILRAGELCRRGGIVVVKVAKPQQDMRFDVPTIGCATDRDRCTRPAPACWPSKRTRRSSSTRTRRSRWRTSTASRSWRRRHEMRHTLWIRHTVFVPVGTAENSPALQCWV